ncbi:MAG TPA: rod shape-determining protein MreC [Candidatus Binataceae bacterium]|nr:rod shape-determining protein MreC [Candidatus Binataceae bacterium]
MQDSKGSFLRRNRVVLAGGILLLLAAHLVSSEVRQGDFLARPQAAALQAMRPIADTFSRATWSARDLLNHYLWLTSVARDNERLRQAVASMPALQTRLAELQRQNQQLAELLDLKDALQLTTVGAAVIGSDATGLSRSLIINQGTQAGVQPGMGVISVAGAVGKVLISGTSVARVLLLSDHNCAIDVFDQRSRARGIVSGLVDDGVVMRYVERTQDIQLGDTLVTSGLDGSFPRGVLVGYVRALVRKGPGLFINVAVRPAVDFRTLERVLVITQSPPHLDDPTQD